MAFFRLRPSNLPQEALDELRAILDNYDRLRQTSQPANAGDDAEMKKLRDKLGSDAGCDTVWWTDLLLAELCVLDLLPQEQLQARIPLWRRRFQEVLGNDTYTDYLKTAPDLSQTQTAQALRADLNELIGDVYYFYAGYAVSARSRTQVSRTLINWAAVVIAVEAAIVVLVLTVPAVVSWLAPQARPSSPATSLSPAPTATQVSARATRPSGSAKVAQSTPHPRSEKSAGPPAPSQMPQSSPTTPLTDWQLVLIWLLTTSACAVVGCVVSVQRRLQDPTVRVDPFYRYIQTTADWFGIAVANPVFAAFFGMIMYGLLVSQLLATKLVTVFSSDGYPKDYSTQAAVLIFGFLSGFAEQLVPDALTRLASSAITGVPGTPSGKLPPEGAGAPGAQGLSGAAQGPLEATSPKPSDVLAGVQTLTGSSPLQPTSEAALLGHDPSLASEATTDDIAKGTN